MDILLILPILIIQSIKDIKSNYINGCLNILLVIIGFIKNILVNESIKEYLLGLIVIPLTLLLLNIIKKDSIGDGDIEYLSAIGFFVGYRNIVISLFISTILLLMYSLYKKKRKYPFIPFITIGVIINQLFITININSINGFFKWHFSSF